MMKKYFPTWAEKITYWDVADLDITDSGKCVVRD